METFMEIPHVTEFLQIVAAMALGSIVGLERSIAGKTAGMRTFGLVSMGAALFMIIALNVIDRFGGTLTLDLLRVITGVITGIGFIGAGLIFFRDEKLRGLTAAAGLWVACGIGIAVALSDYAIAVFAALVTLFTFTILWYIEYGITSFHDELTRSADDEQSGIR